MDSKVEATYNRALSAMALVGFISFLLLSIYRKPLSPVPFYGAVTFLSIVFIGYFFTGWIFPSSDKFLFILAGFLVELGLIMLCRINIELFKRQVAFFALGVGFFILSSILTRYFVRLELNPVYLWGITTALLLLPLLFGVEKGGARNWLAFGGFTFQPSELAKITFVFYLAGVVKQNKINHFPRLAAEILAAVGLLVLSRDLGGAMLFYLTALAVIFAATSRLDVTAAGLFAAGIMGVLSYNLFDHVRVRIEAWLNPWQDVPGRGYQIAQSLFAIAEGGYFGTGLGLGRPDFIPAVATDFIFSAFTEEFGFLGAAAVILMYFLLVYRGIRIALRLKDSYPALIALGHTVMFGMQIFTIIGGVIKLIPVTGVTLPFMSYGGSSMVMSFTSLGILNGLWLQAREGETDGETA
ncbi:FtsW/RodA/SpoVE family cell cycle protein [Thermosediminibacter litoriperuensis]|uniref:Cell division protein FtsW (Lipid II flippase) n=1 Tax=Thermosediminibacter litoriperuensis TaxID=291989 RepID=A0A5S5AM06_9FIRM|nr:FtsW/RodA/SpoVE family cell cycle protein [Thermosediminibacter litoriperuensis]TYP52458.1 cell division protein FtsW (lipid II flippase) [Thermosediminibacter litoriperuensis]